MNEATCVFSDAAVNWFPKSLPDSAQQPNYLGGQTAIEPARGLGDLTVAAQATGVSLWCP